MTVRDKRAAEWLLLTFTLPTKRASQRVGIWRKLQRYGTVPLGNSGYLLPGSSSNEERFQWLAATIRKYGGEASVVRVESIDNLSGPQLQGRFSEARAREYQEPNLGHEAKTGCGSLRVGLADSKIHRPEGAICVCTRRSGASAGRPVRYVSRAWFRSSGRGLHF